MINDFSAAWANFLIKNKSKLRQIIKDKKKSEKNKIWGTLKRKFWSKYNNNQNNKVVIKINNKKLIYIGPTLFTLNNSRILANSVRASYKGKMFSTSCIYGAPDQNNSMDNNTKNNIIKDLEKFDKDNNKPSFRDPGLPDFESVANRSRSQEEFDLLLDKFKAKPSIKEELREHHEEAKRRIAQKWGVQHPEIPTEKVIAVVEKHQKKDYSNPKHSEDYPDLPRKEAKWNEKVDERAFEHGADLPETIDSYYLGDEGMDATPGTPSVKQSPSSEESSQDEDNSSSESSSGYLDENPEHSEDDEGNQDENPEHSEDDEGNQDENSEYSQDSDSQNDSNSQDENSDLDESSGYNSDEDADDENSQDDNPGEARDENSDQNDKASPNEGSENETNKRPLSSYDNDNPSKKLDNKQSPLDYVLEKQSTEMPDIMDSDGGD